MRTALAIVADPKRQQILRLIWSGERPAGEIAREFSVSFAAVSQHLRILRDAGFVSVTKRGRQRLYRANPPALGPIAQYLEAMWRDKLSHLKQLAEAEELK